MIDHVNKCIFVHIPRCGGSSMERFFVKKDWHGIEENTKHLIASHARELYSDYWDDYFKFSFVRNPWSRMVSMSRWGKFNGVKIKDGKLDIRGYIKKLDNGVEIDKRTSYSSCKMKKIISNAIYMNILNEELDFIGKFENYNEDFIKLSDLMKLKINKLPIIKNYDKSKNEKNYTEYYDDETRQLVAEKYAKDIEYFNYKFGE